MLRDRRFIGALILMLVVVGAWDLHHFRTRRNPAQPVARTAPQATPAVLPWRPARPSVASAVSTSLADDARNPFMTAGEQFRGKFPVRTTETMGKGTDPVHLQGIAVHGGVRAALIDGEPVREGGYVGDIQVVRVQDNGVTLARNGRVWRVPLPPVSGEAEEEGK